MRKHTVHEYTLQLIYNPYGWILSFYLCNLQDSVKLNLGFSSSRVINSVLNVSGWNMNVQCCMHAVHGNESIPLSISCSALQLWSPWTKQLCSAISFHCNVSALETADHRLNPLKLGAKNLFFFFKLWVLGIVFSNKKGDSYRRQESGTKRGIIAVTVTDHVF